MTTTTKMGRPIKLTPELQKQLYDLIRRGAFIQTACAFCGINKSTYFHWIKRGNREKQGVYRDFVNAINCARAESEIRDLRNIFNSTDWMASAWRLERFNQNRWGQMRVMEEEVI